MLETIYEVDEDFLHDEDSSKSTKQQSRMSIYMCWCMITGCFFILTFIIMISLNPQYLLHNSTNRNTKNILNVSFHTKEKFELSTQIINYLGLFSQKINKQLNLQLNPIEFLTVPVFNSSTLEILNPNGVLWIYGHLKYPPSCLDNSECKEKFHSKLKTSFDELSYLLKTIDFYSNQSQLIQLDWCNLIDNSTSAIFISLVSMQTVDHNSTDSIIPFDPLICELDQHVLLSQTIDDPISHDDSISLNSKHTNSNTKKVTLMTDSNNIQDEVRTCHNPKQYAKYDGDQNNQHEQSMHCLNDIGAQHLMMSNLI
ncbi:hypothetical protein I4U23_029225 [Adineta vaga]|nr:hypothetical protein I4U23_029225 [Adineta vaga]